MDKQSELATDRATALALVRFFSIEKALYEVMYELANRPTWLAIPLRSVLALIDQPTEAFAPPADDPRQAHAGLP